MRHNREWEGGKNRHYGISKKYLFRTVENSECKSIHEIYEEWIDVNSDI